MRRHLAIALTLLAVTSTVQAQSLEDRLSEVGSAYAQAYVKPLVDATTQNFNTGLVHVARGSNRLLGLNVYAGVKVFATFVPSDEQTFDLDYSGRTNITINTPGGPMDFNVPAQFSVQGAPTVFGPQSAGEATVTASYDTTVVFNGIPFQASGDTSFTFNTLGGLVQTRVAPLLIPEAAIGTVFGTQLMVRWLPEVNFSDYGSLGIVGVGLRHSPNVYLPMLPVGVAVQVMWQKLNIKNGDGGSIVEATMRAANVAVNKHFGPLFVYGGLQIEASNTDLAYTFMPESFGGVASLEPIPISFSQKGAAHRRAIVGFAVQPGPIRFSVDANFGNHANAFSTGIGLAF